MTQQDPWGGLRFNLPGEQGREPIVERVDMIGQFLRLSATISLGRFERLSDYINLTEGFISVGEAAILKRSGEPTNVVLPELSVRRDEMTLIGEVRSATDSDRSGHGMYIPKVPRPLIFVTRGHVVRGDFHLPPGGSVESFAEATDPRFVPVSNVHIRSLYDRRVISHYAFALLNRTQLVAVGDSESLERI